MNRPHMTERLTALPAHSNLFHLCSVRYVRRMHEGDRPLARDELVFDVEQALRKGKKLWPRKLPSGHSGSFRPLAEKIVEHLELCGMRWSRRPSSKSHGTPAE